MIAAAVTMTVLFVLIVLTVCIAACHAAPKGGWDYSDHHARGTTDDLHRSYPP